MVGKKFNFYNVYKVYYKNKIYYKNINESVFLYDYKIIEDFDWLYDYERFSWVWVNYIGMFYILSVNFILYTNLCVLKTILYNRKPMIRPPFKTKKFFFNVRLYDYNRINFLRKDTHNLFLISSN